MHPGSPGHPIAFAIAIASVVVGTICLLLAIRAYRAFRRPPDSPGVSGIHVAVDRYRILGAGILAGGLASAAVIATGFESLEHGRPEIVTDVPRLNDCSPGDCSPRIAVTTHIKKKSCTAILEYDDGWQAKYDSSDASAPHDYRIRAVSTNFSGTPVAITAIAICPLVGGVKKSCVATAGSDVGYDRWTIMPHSGSTATLRLMPASAPHVAAASNGIAFLLDDGNGHSCPLDPVIGNDGN